MKNPHLPPLTLASTSPYRQRLLGRLRLPFCSVAPGVTETAQPDEAPQDLALRLAIEKAQAVGDIAGWVMGSDQVAECGGRCLGKPGTAAAAAQQLAGMAGRWVTFYTAVALWHPQTKILHTHIEPYAVLLRTLSSREIDDYVALDNPIDCAGSFKWESLGITLFAEMRGADPTALEGLPLIAASRLLRDAGYALPPPPEFAADCG